ncbi:MAG: OmpA family protein [Leptospiraceae bacterium]|nr:OmpA family protein [Leptospiraceae bacterium]
MKKFTLITTLTMILLLVSCSSTPDTKTDLLAQLNAELQPLEIEGFEPDKSTLKDSVYSEWSKKNLPILKAITGKIPGEYQLLVTGHADPYGGIAKAEKVAKGRAEEIRKRLGKDGIDVSKIGVKSYGTAEYEAEKGQSVSKNRRVEFEVIKK